LHLEEWPADPFFTSVEVIASLRNTARARRKDDAMKTVAGIFQNDFKQLLKLNN
jgi:hypothetical protein